MTSQSTRPNPAANWMCAICAGVIFITAAGLSRSTGDLSQISADRTVAEVTVSGIVFTRVPADGEDGRGPWRVPGAAVHLRNLPAGWDAGPSAEPVELKFHDGRLVPEFACLQVGQELRIEAPKGAPMMILVSTPTRSEFGKTMIDANPDVFTDRFDKPDDFVSLTCAFHQRSRAYLQVVPSPVFTLADECGRFVLPRRLPPGEYVVKGYFPDAGWGETSVTVRGDEAEVRIELELSRWFKR